MFVRIQDTLQAENASQMYIQQMFRRQQPHAPAEKQSIQPKGMCLPYADRLYLCCCALWSVHGLAVAVKPHPYRLSK